MKIILICFVFLCLTGCGNMPLYEAETIAQKSYEIGCIERGTGSPVDNLQCHMSSEKFHNELQKVWER